MFVQREIHCKLVYYGLGLSGKTTNLKYIYSAVPGQTKGDLLTVDTETERTLFFDLPQIARYFCGALSVYCLCAARFRYRIRWTR
jgi:hypothetical protein